MARDISIAISAKDNFSDAVTKMRTAGVHFNKNLEEMEAQLKRVNANRATLKLDTDTAKKNLQALQKEISETKKTSKDGVVSEELMKKLDAANEEYERMRQNMGLLDKAAKDTGKSMTEATGMFSKLESRVGGGARGGGAKEGLLTALATSGLAGMAKDFVSTAAEGWVQSAYGSETGTIFSGVFSGAASGAAAGTMLGTALAPGVGTAIGAGLGAAAGLASGAFQVYGQQDDSFKSTRSEMISEQQTRLQGDTQAGIGIASGRQLDQISFSTMFKDEDQAKDYLNWVKDTANTTPFLYDDLKGMSKTLATYGYSPEEMKGELLNIGDTGAALGMNNQDMSMVATGLGRMRSSGKTTLEYLNLLVERGIPAIDYLGESLGVSTSEVYDMVSKGLIPGADAARAIADAMGEANAGAMEAMSKTFSGLSSNVEGLEQERQNARGEGYLQEREKGLKAQADYLQSDPELMRETERQIGEWEASLENDREQLLRKHENEARLRIKEKGLVGAEVGRAMMEARIAAEAEFNASEGAQLKLESELAMTESVTKKLADDPRFWNANYELGKAASKGMAAGMAEGFFGINEEALGVAKDFAIPGRTLTRDEFNRMNGIMATDEAWSAYSLPNSAYEQLPGKAYGLSYVPYNDFPARLHEGERVLTASEARGYRTGGAVTVAKLADTIVVREDADIDRIAAELARKLKEMQMVS